MQKFGSGELIGNAVDKTELTTKEIECNILSSNIINDKQIQIGRAHV